MSLLVKKRLPSIVKEVILGAVCLYVCGEREGGGEMSQCVKVLTT